MALELATAYVSLVVDAKQVPGQVQGVFNQVQGDAEKSGKGIGSKLAGGMGTALKAGGLALGAAAGLAVGTALTQGMNRAISIDDAQGKLRGLGHDAEGITTIMDSALKSVKGTAFGLGDAATIAASAVAAGIKPGEELTKYLSLTGDAASIAGTSLEEMGSIFNKVQTSGTVFTDNLNQLSDRGIPIFQWLQDEYQVSADELSKMVKGGEVDAATFKKVIEENIGGAALASGDTLRGSFENMKSALGRVGAGAITPFLPILKNSMGKLTEFADVITPKVQAGSERVANGLMDLGRAFQSSGEGIDGTGNKMERAGVFLRKFTDGVQGVYSIIAKGDFAGSKMTFGLDEDSGVVDKLFKIRETAIGVYDILFNGDYTSPIWGGEEDSKAVDVLFRIREAAEAAWEALKSPSGDKFSAFMDALKGSSEGAAGGMEEASGATSALKGALSSVTAGFAGGGIAALSLFGDTASVVATGIGVLADVMGFLADHSALVGGAMAVLAASFVTAQVAQTAFHIARTIAVAQVPAQLAAQRALTQALIAHTAALRADIVAQGGQAPVEQAGIISRTRAAVATRAAAVASNLRTRAVQAETSALGAYAVAQRAAAANSGLLVGGVRQAAASTALLGAAAGQAAAGGMSRLRSGMGSAVSFLGGPWALGIGAAVAALAGFVLAHNKTNRAVEESEAALRNSKRSFAEYKTAVSDALNESNGRVSTGVKSAVATQIAAIDTQLKETADRAPGLWQKIVGVGETAFTLGNSNKVGDLAGLDIAGERAQKSINALEKLNLTQDQVASAVTGSSTAFNTFKESLYGTGEGAGVVVGKYQAMRDEFIKSQSTASAVGDALSSINEGAFSAANGVDSLKNALKRLLDDQLTVEDAQASLTLAMSGFQTAAAEAGAAAFNAAGQIDVSTAAGARLHSEMRQVSDAFAGAGAAAYQSALEQTGSVEQAAAAAEAAGQRIRDDFIRQRMEAGASLEQATALADQYRLFPKEIPTAIQLNTNNAQTDLNNFYEKNNNKGLKWFVDVVEGNQPTRSPTAGSNLPGPAGSILTRAEGGPVYGAGGPTSDSIPALLSNNEHVLTAAEVEAAGGHQGVFRLRQEIRRGALRRAAGGPVTRDGISAALDAGRSVEGNKYVWGGTGPTGFDCSGFVGWLQQIVQGVIGSTKRLYTTYSLLDGATAGLVSGLGPAGTRFQVGVSQEHMAATVDGQAAESGGAHGTSGIGGGRASAQDGQFPYKFHLPNELIQGYVEGAYSEQSVDGGAPAGMRKAPEWSDKQELDLESARVSITQSEEDRDKVQAKVNEGKASQADLDQANLKVQKAQQKVVDLQKKKDEAGSYVEDGPAPQAPPLERAYNDSEARLLDAQIAVEEANKRRNEVYDKADSTDLERQKADAVLSRAQQELEEIRAGKDEAAGASSSGGTSGQSFSLKDRLKQFGTDVVGIITDAAFAQMPFGLGESRWWDIPIPEFGPQNGDGKKAAPEGSFTPEQVDNQLGFAPPKGEQAPPNWVAEMMRTGDYPGAEVAGVQEDSPWVDILLKLRDGTNAPKVYDTGGWLEPGETAINLSNKPEPIFNSPKQLNQFADGLRPRKPEPTHVDNSIHIHDPKIDDFREFESRLKVHQWQRVGGLSGR